MQVESSQEFPYGRWKLENERRERPISASLCQLTTLAPTFPRSSSLSLSFSAHHLNIYSVKLASSTGHSIASVIQWPSVRCSSTTKSCLKCCRSEMSQQRLHHRITLSAISISSWFHMCDHMCFFLGLLEFLPSPSLPSSPLPGPPPPHGEEEMRKKNNTSLLNVMWHWWPLFDPIDRISRPISYQSVNKRWVIAA